MTTLDELGVGQYIPSVGNGFGLHGDFITTILWWIVYLLLIGIIILLIALSLLTFGIIEGQFGLIDYLYGQMNLV